MRTLKYLLILIVVPIFAGQLKYNRNDWMKSGKWVYQDSWARSRGITYNSRCINTRGRVLIERHIFIDEDRDGIEDYPLRFKTDRKCIVVSGHWTSYMTGKYIYLANKVDIDHNIPLKWAHEHGAATWPKFVKRMYANYVASNDTLMYTHLTIVELSLNRSKGARGPNEWLPPTRQCKYIGDFLTLVDTWGLILSEEESEDIGAIQSIYCHGLE